MRAVSDQSRCHGDDDDEWEVGLPPNEEVLLDVTPAVEEVLFHPWLPSGEDDDD